MTGLMNWRGGCSARAEVREPVLVNIDTKDMSKDIYPSLLLPFHLPPTSHSPHSLILPFQVTSLNFSVHSFLFLCYHPKSADVYFTPYTVPCSCSLLFFFHVLYISSFFSFSSYLSRASPGILLPIYRYKTKQNKKTPSIFSLSYLFSLLITTHTHIHTHWHRNLTTCGVY